MVWMAVVSFRFSLSNVKRKRKRERERELASRLILLPGGGGHTTNSARAFG